MCFENLIASINLKFDEIIENTYYSEMIWLCTYELGGNMEIQRPFTSFRLFSS